MDMNEWVLAGVNAAAAAVLLNSGLAKLIAPDPLRRAVAEMFPGFQGENARTAVRGLAVLEIVTAVALLVAPLRTSAVITASALGLAFAAFGLFGKVRGSAAPCGCFGASDDQPLGWTNVAIGLLLAAAYPVNAARGLAEGAAEDYTAGAVLLASTGCLALCVHTHRRLVNRHLMARFRGTRSTSLTAGNEAH